MTFAELEAVLREEFLDDTVEPYAFSEVMVQRLLRQAEVRACRCGACELIYDDTLTMPLVAGRRDYALDPAILKLPRVLWTSADGEGVVEKVTEDSLDSLELDVWRRIGDGSPVRCYVRGRTLLLDRLPTADDVAQDATLNLQVYREPFDGLDAEREEPEIDERHHHALCYWAAYRCLARPDVDSAQAQIAKDNLALFHQHFGAPLDASMIEYQLASAGHLFHIAAEAYRDNYRSRGRGWVEELG